MHSFRRLWFLIRIPNDSLFICLCVWLGVWCIQVAVQLNEHENGDGELEIFLFANPNPDLHHFGDLNVCGTQREKSEGQWGLMSSSVAKKTPNADIISLEWECCDAANVSRNRVHFIHKWMNIESTAHNKSYGFVAGGGILASIVIISLPKTMENDLHKCSCSLATVAYTKCR